MGWFSKGKKDPKPWPQKTYSFPEVEAAMAQVPQWKSQLAPPWLGQATSPFFNLSAALAADVFAYNAWAQLHADFATQPIYFKGIMSSFNNSLGSTSTTHAYLPSGWGTTSASYVDSLSCLSEEAMILHGHFKAEFGPELKAALDLLDNAARVKVGYRAEHSGYGPFNQGVSVVTLNDRGATAFADVKAMFCRAIQEAEEKGL